VELLFHGVTIRAVPPPRTGFIYGPIAPDTARAPL
jgi:hypothetical protein